ncbi:MAG: hypothetical protein HY040_08430 [Planctomycetes bacterium]|nr:hypothetical protein [Planctomycetota bacterium]
MRAAAPLFHQQALAFFQNRLVGLDERRQRHAVGLRLLTGTSQRVAQ